MVCGELIHSLWCVKSSFTHLVCGELNLVCADLKHGCASFFFSTAQAHPSGVVPVVANLETYVTDLDPSERFVRVVSHLEPKDT